MTKTLAKLVSLKLRFRTFTFLPVLFVSWLTIRSSSNCLAGSGESVAELNYWQQQVVKQFPEIGIPGSTANKKYLDAVADLRKTNPQLFDERDWPMKIALEIHKEDAKEQFKALEVNYWQKQAVKQFPEIGVSGSSANKLYLEILSEARKTRPEMLTSSDWPMKIAIEWEEKHLKEIDVNHWKNEVLKQFPEIALSQSPLCKKYSEFESNARTSRPELFARSDWPMQIALELQQCQLASQYFENGKKYPIEDFNESSLEAVKVAAANGNGKAKGILGATYLKGNENQSSPRSPELGIKLLEEFITLGTARSATVLGIIYVNGYKKDDKVIRDRAKGMDFVRIGSALGDKAATEILNDRKINFEMIPEKGCLSLLKKLAQKYRLDKTDDLESHWDRDEKMELFEGMLNIGSALDKGESSWRNVKFDKDWKERDGEIQFEMKNYDLILKQGVVNWTVLVEGEIVTWGSLSIRDIPFILYLYTFARTQGLRNTKIEDDTKTKFFFSDTGAVTASYIFKKGFALKFGDQSLDVSIEKNDMSLEQMKQALLGNLSTPIRTWTEKRNLSYDFLSDVGWFARKAREVRFPKK
jgi:hypothetical protein